MKTRSKALLLMMCAVVLVIGSVFGTIAYLTDTEAVINTFTIGRVGLSLDEKDVDEDDNTKDNVTVNGVIRDTANKYHLLPGHTYPKDPTVHVDADSENAWVFVKVENGIAEIEAATTNGTIAEQIEKNGWKELTGVDNVYYQLYTKGQADKDLEVFAEFKIDGSSVINKQEGDPDTAPGGKFYIDNYKTAQVNVTAYAVQKDGFDTGASDIEKALAAWNATFGK